MKKLLRLRKGRAGSCSLVTTSQCLLNSGQSTLILTIPLPLLSPAQREELAATLFHVKSTRSSYGKKQNGGETGSSQREVEELEQELQKVRADAENGWNTVKGMQEYIAELRDRIVELEGGQ